MRALHRPWLVLLSVALFYAAALFFVASGYGFNASCFLHIGQTAPASDRADLPAGLVLFRGISGYDGLHYYQLARDPLLLAPEEASAFKTRHYLTRHQRLLMPLAAHLAALGQEPWIPLAILAVNGSACLAAAAAFLRLGGPLTGIQAATLPALSIGLFYGLTEPVALALVAWALVFASEGRSGIGATCLALACLSRETAGLFAVALAADRFWAGSRRSGNLWLASLLPAALYGLWLQHRLGANPSSFFDGLAWPLTGFSSQLRQDLKGQAGPLWAALPVWYAAGWTLGALAVSGRALKCAGAPARPMALALGIHAALMLLSYQEVWATTVNACRVLGGTSLAALVLACLPAGSVPGARALALAGLPLHGAALARVLLDRGLPYTLT